MRWYGAFVAERAESIVFGAARRIRGRGGDVPPASAAAVARELARVLGDSPAPPYELPAAAHDFYDAAIDASLRVRAKVFGEGSERFARFASPVAFQAFIAQAIAYKYLSEMRKPRATPVPDEELASAVATAATADTDALLALAEIPLNQLALLKHWWETGSVETDEDFRDLVLAYRTRTDAVMSLAVAFTGSDPADPCADVVHARTRLRAAILASGRLPERSRRGGWTAADDAELIASRAACPLGERPETFASIAARLGRTAAATEKRFERLFRDYDWVVHLTRNRPAPD